MITITYTEYKSPVAYLPNVVYHQVVKNFETCLDDKAEKFVERHCEMTLEKLSLTSGVNVLNNLQIVG